MSPELEAFFIEIAPSVDPMNKGLVEIDKKTRAFS